MKRAILEKILEALLRIEAKLDRIAVPMPAQPQPAPAPNDPPQPGTTDVYPAFPWTQPVALPMVACYGCFVGYDSAGRVMVPATFTDTSCEVKKP